jgi:hypothetical protein
VEATVAAAAGEPAKIADVSATQSSSDKGGNGTAKTSQAEKSGGGRRFKRKGR